MNAATAKTALRMVSIHDRPHDAPDGFAVRFWSIGNDGLLDDPRIVEVWV